MGLSSGKRNLVLGAAFLGSAALASSLVPSSTDDAPALPVKRQLVMEAPLTQAGPPVLGAFAYDEGKQRFVAPWGEHQAVLTLDPSLHKTLSAALERGRAVRGATVLLEAGTGRVIALAGYEHGRGQSEEVALRAFAPAASIFKVTSVSALLRAGLKGHEQVCYSGGKRRLQPKHLEDTQHDRCVAFEDVLPYSLNSAVAKLVDKRLPDGLLAAESVRFGFDRKLPFPRPVETSLAYIPKDRFERAKAAAGFGEVRISALHGALIASVAANDGMLLWPRVIDELSGGEPPPLTKAERAVPERIAKELSRLMGRTVSMGTGHRAFSQRGPALRDIDVAGKTGSLTDYREGADYSWFVGYAPVDNPKVIVATVIENDVALWYVRAPDVARDALEAYFKKRSRDALARRETTGGTRTP